MSDTERRLHDVKIETGPEAMFTQVYIDGEALRGITRVWFDTGDLNGHGPAHSWRNTVRVHIELVPERLFVEGPADPDYVETIPVREVRQNVALPGADPTLMSGYKPPARKPR